MINKFEITVDSEKQITTIKDLDTGIEKKVSLSFILIDCIKIVMS